ncbi:MAG: hypothetical protein LDL41_19445 [Coleofasciculus sp. S288]|nr:hypothetical protein [Coleofasciculus sp. S288]
MATKINAYLKSLNNQGDEIKIESDNSFVTARRTASNRVTIIDILVPQSDRGKGISRELFERLKKEVPSGVKILDLHDDVNPSFWEHLGFRNGIYSL